MYVHRTSATLASDAAHTQHPPIQNDHFQKLCPKNREAGRCLSSLRSAVVRGRAASRAAEVILRSILSVQCLQTSQWGMKTHIAAPALVPNKQRFAIISQLLRTRNVQAAVAGNSTQRICDGVGKQAPVAAAAVARERNHRSTDGVLGLVRMDGRAVLQASVSEETPRSCVLLSVYVPSGASSQRRRHRSRRGSCRSRSRTRCGGRRGSRARSWGPG